MNSTAKNDRSKRTKHANHPPLIEFEVFRAWLFLSVMMLIIFNIDSVLAVEIADLRAPMQNLKKEIWSYMYPIKLAAVAIGAVLSVTQQSLIPFGVGAAIGGGIQFFDTVLGDGSAALI